MRESIIYSHVFLPENLIMSLSSFPLEGMLRRKVFELFKDKQGDQDGFLINSTATFQG